MTVTGTEGCPCINTTETLASLSDRYCALDNGDPGVQLTIGGSCVPPNYGSSTCLQHDLMYDPRCSMDSDHLGESIIPAFCFRPFCYVDVGKCKKYSEERVFRSSYFEVDSGINVYYSYSTCNSTEQDWLVAVDGIVGTSALGGVDILANVPTFQLPMMYKRDSDDEIVLDSSGPEFFDDSSPWEGVYIKYVKDIVEISKGDIASLNITHRSRASKIVHPTSSYTSAVQDLQDGLADMAIGPFWVTAQRLKMTGTAFTLPLIYDKTYLVIPKPGLTQTLSQQTAKVIQPFAIELWLLIIGFILAAAVLSVWFTDSVRNDRSAGRRMGLRGKTKRRKMAYVRLTLDSFLEKGLFFCSAGIEQDSSTSLPNKIMLFGFGLFILVTVSAYVANLAAFLTRNSVTYVRTMDNAVASKYRLCAHPAVQTELEIAWPDADFYWHQDANEFPGVLDDYLLGKCDAMVVGYEDTSMDASFLERLCENDLVFTDSVVAEIPIAFPVRNDLSSGFSYWMYQGERVGVTLQTAKDAFPQDISCDIQFNGEDLEADEYAEITIKNMFFPIMFFTSCAALAILLQLKHMYNESKGKASALGRRSTLDLFEGSNVRKKDKKNRRLSKDSKDDEDIDLDEFSENRRMIRDEGEEKVEDSILRERKVGFMEDSIADQITSTSTSLMAGVAGEGGCTVESVNRFSSLRDDLPQDEERPRGVRSSLDGDA